MWIRVESDDILPTKRAGHSCSYYPNDGSMVIFGGGDVFGEIYSDLYVGEFVGFVEQEEEKREEGVHMQIKVLKNKIDMKHGKVMERLDALKKFLLLMEKEEVENYISINKELSKLQLELDDKKDKS
eukprot:TRINITY_DN12765_c0_g1_i10.p7 TRINITY_DN12765_c0_g1~~TRINITY_DN12765_c0_g1_i10.p7  ORF type:complete len:127 (-),score=38.19 TRINITY_DN12765_c0_g1_i10:150-530(-)